MCPTGCVHNTIQGAIESAADGDFILIGKGHYFENLRTLGKRLTLVGVNNRQAIIDGNGNGPVITVTGENLLTLRGLTITRGFGAGGGVTVLERASLDIRHSIVVSNYSTTSGGGISINPSQLSFGNLTVFDCTISDNQAVNDGGGIFVNTENTTVAISNSTLARNIAGGRNSGGAIFLDGNEVVATITNASIVDNSAGVGGGIDAEDEVTLTVASSTLAGNTAVFNGGGANYSQSTVTFTNDVLTRNQAGGSGGAIAASTGTFRPFFSDTILNTVFVIGNSASTDGGGLSIQGTLTAQSVVLQNNLPDGCAAGTVCP